MPLHVGACTHARIFFKPMTSIYVKYSRQKFAPVHAMKAYKGVKVQLHSFSTLALDGG
jgi:hypothetical protein